MEANWRIFLEESSTSTNFLAPETSHITALKIKDYIISSLLLARHYSRLVVDDHSITDIAVGLACQVEFPVAGGYV
jgi:hypothetical protein